MKNLFGLVLGLLISLTLSGQQLSDAVYLKDGSILKGTIIENTDSVLKIQISGGSIFAFTSNQIEKISVFNGSKRRPVGKPFSYLGFVSAGWLIGSSKNEKESPVSILTEQNIRIYQNFSMGLLTGIEILNESVLPIGINTKGLLTLKNGDVLFLGVSGGYLYSLEKPYDPQNQVLDHSGGSFVNVEMGVVFPSGGNANFFMAMGYRYAELHYKYSDWYFSQVDQDMYFKRFSVRMGVLIR